MAPMNKKGIVEETEIQRRAREGFENLAAKKYDEVCALVLALVRESDLQIEKGDVTTWKIYAGLLAHCLLCWQPKMRDTVQKIDEEACSFLVKLPDADQEEFFVFSQRLEDHFDNDMIGGLGMYLHALLLIATGDKEHEPNVLKDAENLKEPLSSLQLAIDAIEAHNLEEAKRFLEIAIAAEQPCAIEIANLHIENKTFSDEVSKELKDMLSSCKSYKIEGDAIAALSLKNRFTSTKTSPALGDDGGVHSDDDRSDASSFHGSDDDDDDDDDDGSDDDSGDDDDDGDSAASPMDSEYEEDSEMEFIE